MYVRMKSNNTQIVGIHTDYEGSSNIKKLIMKVGAPTGINNDNSKMHTIKVWYELLRHYWIENYTREPNNYHNNTADRNTQDLKKNINRIMNRTNTPTSCGYAVWFFTMILNIVAMSTLVNKRKIKYAVIIIIF